MTRSFPVSMRLAVGSILFLLALSLPKPGWGAVATDAIVFKDSASSLSSITTPTFSTTAGNELLLAFVSTDASRSGMQVTGVTGGGLTWVLVRRTNVQQGTAEIWRAFAAAPLAGVTVRANLSQPVPGTLTVVSFTGVDPSGTNGSAAIGATGTGNALLGAPTASLVTTRNQSWVWGVGTDWDDDTARTLGPNQAMVHEFLSAFGSTHWVQRQSSATPAIGTSVSINCTAPANHRYNLSLVEILPPTGPTPPVATIITPANNSFYFTGQNIALSGSALDAQSPPDSLALAWIVDLVFGSHTQPGYQSFNGPTASYAGAQLDDGTGVRQVIKLTASDPGGLVSDTARVTIWPEIDLAPSAVTVGGGSPVAGQSAHYTFSIQNGGRMPAHASRWALRAGGTLLGQGDTAVPANGQTALAVDATLAAGTYTLRLTADSLGAVRETNEANNVWTGTLVVLPPGAANEIVLENQLAGNPASEWDVAGAGDPSIQGYATDISVDQGSVISFKILTASTNYRLDIYRLGYYGGLGARRVATVQPSAALPQSQPGCLTDPATGLTDCGNWAVSASWTVPANATSGLYIAKLVREDPVDGRASHIPFIVRDDDGGSSLLFQTSETTWQAYNSYGGNSLYVGSATTPPVPRAHKVSFNRPFNTRANSNEDWFMNSEYPMIRWLERNGYDVSYFTDTDTDRRGTELLEHDVFLSVGHDEYWSAGQRAAVEAARGAGVHLAFLSGNEIYWKTRWEPSTDGSGTSYRTLVCYKEGTAGEITCGGKCDPLPDVWTGLWREGCAFTPPADGCRPENALSGQISWQGSTGTIQVPDTYKSLRFWRNTAVASLGAGQTLALAENTLGYEWNFEQFPSFYPPGRVHFSRTILDNRTHHLSLYRHASGALVFGAGTVQWMWGLDGVHDRGASTPNAAMQQATVNLLAEMGAQPGTLQPGLVAASATGDLTAPTSTIGFPVPGSSVPSGSPVTVTGTASDPGGGVVGGVEVSVDGGTTWLPAEGGANWSFVWVPGAPGPANLRARAVDDWGNLQSPGGGTNVTVVSAPPAACPCTIWPPLAQGNEGNDGSAVEVGVRFRSEVAGTIEGIRFYKHPGNTGTHVGRLWTNAGVRLESGTFTGETATGWQEVLFDTAVAIAPNVTYVASVFMPVGRYAFQGSYFSTQGFDNPPLHALQSGVDGANGVYEYTATGAFPTQTFNAGNYGIDVRFNTPGGGPDGAAPLVTAITPGNGASGIPVTTNVTATFNEALDAATVNGTTVELHAPGNVLVTAVVTYHGASRTVTLAPTTLLAHLTTYTVTLQGGAADPRLKDVSGNALAGDLQWSFTTGAPPPAPPNEGPGGPILVISSASNPFSRYLAEILRAEGLNAFTAMDISLVTAGVLSGYDVVVLGELPLSAAQVTMLTNWVTAGGNLIAMRPDPQLAALLGLTAPAGTLGNRYLLVNGTGPGAGIVGQTIQYHGLADLYALNGATAVATLYSDAATATSNPAVTLRTIGGSGGQAAAFTYDLARSVVYTRQGNPAWAGQERDGIAPVRAVDMFYGAAAGDPQPDWVDFNKIGIPQADEQQRLLANLILSMNRDRKPLPRFWYFPRGHKAVVIMTGDNHGDAGMAPRFNTYLAQSPAGCSVGDWECVRASGYLYVGNNLTNAQALSYHNQGFEVGLHFNTNCNNFTPASLRNDFDTQIAGFAGTFSSLPIQNTNRTHCVPWSDWATHARAETERGIRLDTNYYYWGPTWVQDRPGLFTGSGIPMRFADLDGTLIDCFQAPTQMTDESGQSYPFTANTLLDRALGAEGYYGAFCANMHFDSAPHSGSDAIVASAQARGVPVVSGRQMLQWLDGRNNSAFGNLAWNANQLSFTLGVGAGATNLRALLPVQSAVGTLGTLTRNGSPVAFTTQVIKGIEYAMFPAAAGNHVATYVVDATGPAITSLLGVPRSGTATISWNTNEPADSRVDYGTSAGALNLNVTGAALVTSHQLVLPALAPNTTYYYRAVSADAAANPTTEPPSGSPPLSFTTPAPTCAMDDSVAHFAAGTAGAGTRVVQAADGEVTLAPAAGAEFSVLPPTTEWQSFPWSAGGASTVSGGMLLVDGARFNSEPASGFGPGTSIEFVATFRAAPFQHVGFGSGNDVAPGEIFNTPFLAIFTTGNGGGTLIARSANGGAFTDSTLGTSLVGTPHRYRVDWNAGSVSFYVDGLLRVTHTVAIGGVMRPAASDFAIGGPVLDLDWIRVKPYAASGSFTSRVFDGGGNVTWGAVQWTADTPAGTGLGILARTGFSPTPDPGWTAFVAVPSSGAPLNATARYVQYRADLSTTDPRSTPTLHDVVLACSPAAPDTTPPTITATQATPAVGGVAADVAWNTNEPGDSRVDYGTAPGTLNHHEQAAVFTMSHLVPLSGLGPNTTYYYRVTSMDPSGNLKTEPPLGNPPLSFLTLPGTPVTCGGDDLDTDFASGTTGGNTRVARAVDGEVTLAPTLFEDFSTTPPTSAWQGFAWGGGGTTNVSGGVVTVDGAKFVAEPVAGFTSGRSLEFVATFGAAPFQHVGWGSGTDTPPNDIFSVVPVALFSTTGTGTQVYARISNGGAYTDTPLGAGLLGTSHRYRIHWNAASVDYYVDGALAISYALAIGGTMRPGASDFNVGGPTVVVDWIQITPYAASGSFTSRVFDAGGGAGWDAVQWTADTPAGTTIALWARRGGTSSPDGTWTAFAQLASSGATVGGASRYVQYRADLATTAPFVTPILHDVTLQCVTTGPDVAGPMISGETADPGMDGTTATVMWNTDEPANARVDYGTSANALNQNAQLATLALSRSVPLTGLTPGTTYYYRMTSEDTLGNPTTKPPTGDAPLSFMTPVPTCAMDDTEADFLAGTSFADVRVIARGDGELIAGPLAMAEFATLPPIGEWRGIAWNAGGGTTVSNGMLLVDGAYFISQPEEPGFGPGVSLEFTATFTATTFQHVGFATGDDGETFSILPLALLSTGSTGTQVYARSSNGGPFTETPLGAGLIGTSHRYRIDWNAASIGYFVDGVSVVSHPVAIGGTMRPGMSDFNVGGPSLAVDWIVLRPYDAHGMFVSRIFDAGTSVDWGVLSWTADTPAGTSVTFFTRGGDTPSPDPTWTSQTPVPASGDVGLAARYIQYIVNLETTNPLATATIQDVTLRCSPLGPDLPPVISDVAAAPEIGGTSATITWNTDEPADSRVDYGSSPGLLDQSVQNAIDELTHGIPIASLLPNTTYYYRVTSEDPGGHAATQPPLLETPLSFLTGALTCAADNTEADFLAGTPGVDTRVTIEGSVILDPQAIAEFATLPPVTEWQSFPWNPGGNVSVSGGELIADGARFVSEPEAGFGPGVSLEFVATFDTAPFQHVGFASGTDANLFNGTPLVILSTRNGDNLYARTLTAATSIETPLGTSLLNASHHYRVVWNSGSIDYYVDGALAVSHPIAVAGTMRPVISDYDVGGFALGVDWILLKPYAPSGTFTSRVFDAGSPMVWGAVHWAAQTPVGTSAAVSARTGDTPVPDGTWTSFLALASSGSSLGQTSRYLQYRVALATGNIDDTPSFEAITFACSPVPAAVPSLTIDDVSHAEGDSGVTVYDFSVDLSEPVAGEVRVDLSTEDGSADSSDGDYEPRAFTVVLSPMASGVIVHIEVPGDRKREGDESFTVRLSNPQGATIADTTGVGTIQNDDPVPTMVIGDVFLAEGNADSTSFVFPLVLSNATAETVRVFAETADSTATENQDYTPVAGYVVIPPGSTAGSITVSVRGDLALEDDEVFHIELDSPTACTVLDNTARGVVLNDDGLPALSVGNALPVAEGHVDSTDLVFLVSMTNPSAQTVTVTASAFDGTAHTSDNDFTGFLRTIAIPPDSTSARVVVKVKGDRRVETDETVLFQISNAQGATITDDEDLAEGTILNDDAAPLVHLLVPDGGETWPTSGQQNIQWTAQDDGTVTAVDLAYSTDGGGTYPNVIATGIPNTGTYGWTLPAAPLSLARVRVTAHDDGGNSGADASDANFSTAVANFASNPGFETDASGWARYGSVLPAVSRLAGTPPTTHSGVGCLRVVAGNTSSFGVDDSPDFVPRVVTRGAVYRYSLWIRSAATRGGSAELQIRELLGSSPQGQTAFSQRIQLSTTWQFLTMDYTVRTSGSLLSLRVVDFPPPATETFMIDDVSVVLVSAPPDSPPVVVSPPAVNGSVGVPISFGVTASDADAQPITILQRTTGPAASTFNVNAAQTGGTFVWNPTAADVGTHTVIFTASNALTGADTTQIQIGASLPNLCGNPGFETGTTGWAPYGNVNLSRVRDSSPSDSALQMQGTSFSAFGIDDQPDWVANVTSLGAMYRFSAWIRSATGAVGGAGIRVQEILNGGQSAPVNSPPLNVSPDWQPMIVTYTTQTIGSHLSMRLTYAPGTNGEIVLVDDVSIVQLNTSTSATPLIEFSGGTGAAGLRAFVDAGEWGSDHPGPWCVRFEGLPSEMVALVPSFTLRVGSGEATSLIERTTRGEDRDGNGIEEVGARFDPAAVRGLIEEGASGGQVEALLEARSEGWAPVSAPLALEIESAPRLVYAARVVPNPMRVAGTLLLTLSRPTWIRVDLFDVNGRRVEAVREIDLQPGAHQVPLGRNGLASGLYFYRVQSLEGTLEGRFVLVK